MEQPGHSTVARSRGELAESVVAFESNDDLRASEALGLGKSQGRHSRRHRHPAAAWIGLNPTRLEHFANDILAGRHSIEVVRTIGGGESLPLTGVGLTIVIGIKENAPSCQPGFANRALTIGVEVAEYDSGNRRQVPTTFKRLQRNERTPRSDFV